jgi:hypothetical protein
LAFQDEAIELDLPQFPLHKMGNNHPSITGFA